MGGRREVSILSYRPVTRSDLKKERSFFRGSVSTFLQPVVAFLAQANGLEKSAKSPCIGNGMSARAGKAT